MTKKISIISTVAHRVGVNNPDLRINRKWTGKGFTIKFDKEEVEELMYDPGFAYLINNGVLYIEDLEDKKSLGIEPEDAEEPVNVIVLTEAQKKNFMTAMTLKTFKKKIDELPKEQLNELTSYAIEHKLTDITKTNILKEKTGRDIIKTIQLNEGD